jgi:predicted choloylglycine hydrolase
MSLTFRAVEESDPGPKWAGLFSQYWPAYAKWWAREGISGRPTYAECRNAIKRHMPEIVGLYDRLCELAGGGDRQSRFLSFYCPPQYLAGCSQAVWAGDRPLIVRNYDYSPDALDAIILKSGWNGRGVIGTTDGLFGLVDGVNDAGLAVSLTFGGRRAVGEGFGVPLIIRYVLQCCETAEEAAETLRRLPSHMSYNVTVLDRAHSYFTVYMSPDRPAVVSRTPVATNHQEQVEWVSHARRTSTVERERFLLQRLTLHPETQDRFIRAFLQPPLYSTEFASGFGTLYTAAYRPDEGSVEIIWPDHRWRKGFTNFTEDAVAISYPYAVSL